MYHGMDLKYLLALMFAILILAPITPSSAQPAWSFEVEILPHKLYMGEWGNLSIRITNYECGYRAPLSKLELKGVSERYLDDVTSRIEKMRAKDLIKDYEVKVERAWGVGGDVFYDAVLEVYGACTGAPIKIKGLNLWFAWRMGGGRDAGFAVELDKVLDAYDALAYALEGEEGVSGATVIANFTVFIPPNISPEERASPPGPFLDITVDYPGWITYTFQNYPLKGAFRIQPYRTFNLTLTDNFGEDILDGVARIILRRLIHYYDSREYLAVNGVARIERLLEDSYDIEVYWNSSRFQQERPLVYKGVATAYELASRGLRVNVLPVAIRALDEKERPLAGALVRLDGVEAVADAGGWVRYPLVPHGNHALSIWWMGYELHEEWVWVGYHPTLSPEIKKFVREARLPVNDLIVRVLDRYGNPLPSNITVEDPRGVIPRIEARSENGTLIIPQLPVVDYSIRASTYSREFEALAENSTTCKPVTCDVVLPLYGVRLEVVDLGGKALAGALVKLGPASARTDDYGSAIIPAVPGGEYALEVYWRGRPVYSDVVRIASPIEKKIVASVYSVSLKLVTADGDPYEAYWILVDSSGTVHSSMKPSSTLSASGLTPGPCKIVVNSTDGGATFDYLYDADQLARMRELRLPVGAIFVVARLQNGAPISWGSVSLIKDGEVRYSADLDRDGRAKVHQVAFGRYLVNVKTRGGLLILSQEVSVSGGNLTLIVPCSSVRVRVVDALGNPLSGALVEVSYGPAILASGSTGDDGVFEVPCVPEAQNYRISVSYRNKQVGDLARPGEPRAIQVDVIRVGGVAMDAAQFGALATAAILAMMAPLFVLGIRRRRRSE